MQAFQLSTGYVVETEGDAISDEIRQYENLLSGVLGEHLHEIFEDCSEEDSLMELVEILENEVDYILSNQVRTSKRLLRKILVIDLLRMWRVIGDEIKKQRNSPGAN